MTMNTKDEILDSIKNGDFYGYLCNNAWKLSHYDLVTILKEYVYQYEDNALYRMTGNIIDELIENLDAD